MDPGVWVALIAVFGAQLGATVTLVIGGRQRTREAAAAAEAAEKATAAAAKERREERQQDFDRSEQVRLAAEAVRVAVEGAAVKAERVAQRAETAAALLAGRDERQEQEAEAARLQAQEAAALLLEAQQETISRTNEVARIAKANAVTTTAKLEEIHHLVNSSMTAAMMGELGAVGRELAMMREVVALHKVAGHQPSTDALAAITATEAKLAELQAAVEDREKQTAEAERLAGR